MGFIINDNITINNGLSITNAYAAIGHNTIKLRKLSEPGINPTESDPVYSLFGLGFIWSNKEYRNMGGKSKVDRYLINIDLTSSQLGSNLYELLYNEWKSIYTSVTDDL